MSESNSAIPIPGLRVKEVQTVSPWGRREVRGGSARQACRRAVLGVIGAALSLTLAGALPAQAGIQLFPGDTPPDRWGRTLSCELAQDQATLILWTGRSAQRIAQLPGRPNGSGMNDAGHVVWAAPRAGGIYLWKDGESRRLDDPARPGVLPVINDLDQVAWQGYDAHRGIYLWNGRRVLRIGDADAVVAPDRIHMSNAGHVVWESGFRIFLWDGVQTREIPAPEGENTGPRVNDDGVVVWQWRQPGPAPQPGRVFLWDGEEIRSLTAALPPTERHGIGTNGAQINNRGQVVWTQMDQRTKSQNLWLWNGVTAQRLLDSVRGESNEQPRLNERGHVLWVRPMPANAPELFCWDGTSVRQVTRNFQPEPGHGFDRDGHIVWNTSRCVASVLSLAVTPAEVELGESATGALLLQSPAPRGGAVVALASPYPRLVTVPSSVTIPAGATRATFPIQTAAEPLTRPVADGDSPGVIGDLRGMIRATYEGVTEEAPFVVHGGSLTVAPAAESDAAPAPVPTRGGATSPTPLDAPTRPAADVAATPPASDPALATPRPAANAGSTPERPATTPETTTRPAVSTTPPTPEPVTRPAANTTAATPTPEPVTRPAAAETPARPAAATGSNTATRPAAEPAPTTTVTRPAATTTTTAPERPAATEAATRPAANATPPAEPAPAPTPEPVTRPAANASPVTTVATETTTRAAANTSAPAAPAAATTPERPAANATTTASAPVAPAATTPRPAPTTARVVPSTSADMLQRMAELLKALGM